VEDAILRPVSCGLPTFEVLGDVAFFRKSTEERLAIVLRIPSSLAYPPGRDSGGPHRPAPFRSRLGQWQIEQWDPHEELPAFSRNAPAKSRMSPPPRMASTLLPLALKLLLKIAKAV